MPSPFSSVNHVGFVVTNLDAAITFFTETLGFKAIPERRGNLVPSGDTHARRFGVHAEAIRTVRIPQNRRFVDRVARVVGARSKPDFAIELRLRRSPCRDQRLRHPGRIEASAQRRWRHGPRAKRRRLYLLRYSVWPGNPVDSGVSHPSGHDLSIDDYLIRNQASWTASAAEFAIDAESLWPSDPVWGIFSLPEEEVGMFPADLHGKDVIELGCGTGYVSAWAARLGANPVGIDLTEAQLETARAMQEKHGISFPLVLGNAEATPFADECADLVISEYGASIWCDPYRWIPEAHRLLRSGVSSVFFAHIPSSMSARPTIQMEPSDSSLFGTCSVCTR